MNTDHIQSIHTTQTALAHTGSTALREGSSVSGRVIQKTGPQSYVVSLAGQKIEVRSEQNLVPGSLFTAKIAVRGETVTLVLQHAPVAGTDAAGAEKSAETSLVQIASSLQNEALAQMLASLGLPVTEGAVRLIQLAQELGVKINPKSIKKALAQAEKFKGSEKEAAEVAVLLSEKGLESGEKAVQAVLGGAHQTKTRKPDDEHGDAENSELMKAYVESADEAAVTHKPGALTVFNMLGTSFDYSVHDADSADCVRQENVVRGSGLNWITLPFEWTCQLPSEKGEKSSEFTGVIRVLKTESEKNPKKIVIECQSSLTKYAVVLYLVSGNLKKVVFGISPAAGNAKQCALTAELKSILSAAAGKGSSISVSYTDFKLLSGFCSDDVPVSLVEGEI